MSVEAIMAALAMLILASPLALVGALGTAALTGINVSEENIGRMTFGSLIVAFCSAVLFTGFMVLNATPRTTLEFGDWVTIPQEHFHFHLQFLFDRLSLPMVVLVCVLCGTIGAFTRRYLHREPGYFRFYFMYSIFTLGMVVSVLAGTIEVLFAGWELVGLSSALLVGFFHDRQAPVANGQRVWSIYRFADAAFLLAAVALHHMTGAGDFVQMLGTGAWPQGQASLSADQSFWVGLLLLTAAAGKSALIPFSGWLPRAMEGPTPSSAIFYGALSVHLGAYLLLRVSPLLHASAVLSGCVIGLGVLTAVFAALATRVQTDIKSQLAFASLMQVGLIVMEIGCGFTYLPLLHIIGHASLRTLQLLRAPTLLRDHYQLECVMGPEEAEGAVRVRPWSIAVYRFALERGYLDSLLQDYVANPFLNCFRKFSEWEQAWIRWVSQGLSGAVHSKDELDQQAMSEKWPSASSSGEAFEHE